MTGSATGHCVAPAPNTSPLGCIHSEMEFVVEFKSSPDIWRPADQIISIQKNAVAQKFRQLYHKKYEQRSHVRFINYFSFSIVEFEFVVHSIIYLCWWMTACFVFNERRNSLRRIAACYNSSVSCHTAAHASCCPIVALTQVINDFCILCRREQFFPPAAAADGMSAHPQHMT